MDNKRLFFPQIINNAREPRIILRSVFQPYTHRNMMHLLENKSPRRVSAAQTSTTKARYKLTFFIGSLFLVFQRSHILHSTYAHIIYILAHRLEKSETR